MLREKGIATASQEWRAVSAGRSGRDDDLHTVLRAKDWDEVTPEQRGWAVGTCSQRAGRTRVRMTGVSPPCSSALSVDAEPAFTSWFMLCRRLNERDICCWTPREADSRADVQCAAAE